MSYGVGPHQLRRLALALGVAMGVSLLVLRPGSSVGEPTRVLQPDPRITPGQVIDGWTGLPIPCRCRYQGQAYRLGEIVCMNTHVGTVLTRCELFMNNTSWVPSQEPCTISQASSRSFAALSPDP
jgi:hypothetical protein